MIKIEKIQLRNFRFFRDEEKHNTFEPNEKGMLVYGENGSGKSSLFRAFELLATPTISAEEFAKNVNIFKNDDTYLEFNFSNAEPSLRIDSDELSLDNHEPFVKTLSVSKPMIEYKQLLKVSYSNTNNQNLYKFFETILENYPIDNPEDDINVLKDLNGEAFFSTFKEIIKENILEDVNYYLNAFKQNIKIVDVRFDGFDKTTFLDINFFDENITTYHHFLNEARLSALAISIYFAIIKKQFTLLGDNSLKILVLDDLLISLDMNNRLSLINILQNEFSEFQIFFFTHDKAFFEVLKDKMSWKAYEIYVNKNDEGYEVPFIKKSLNYFESAKKHFEDFDYPACANYLRKEVERLKKIKEKQELSINQDKTLFKKVKKMILSSDLSDNNDIKKKLIGFKKGLEEQHDAVVEIDLRNIKSITDRILNPQSHDDMSRPLYKKELEDAIETIKSLRDTL